MKTELFEAVLRGILVRRMKTALVGGLLILAALCPPAHANIFWSGTLFSGETVQFAYTGSIPTELSASIDAGGASVPSSLIAISHSTWAATALLIMIGRQVRASAAYHFFKPDHHFLLL
jgi:hypothetical protein